MHFSAYGDPSRPAVLCMHGMLQNGQSMREKLSGLETAFRVIFPTMSCYCEQQDFISFADEAAQIEAYVQAHCGGRLRGFYGLSQGAALGLELLARGRIQIDFVVLDGAYVARQGRLAALFAYRFILFWRNRKEKLPRLLKHFLVLTGTPKEQAKQKAEALSRQVCWPKKDEAFRRNCLENYTYGVRPELARTKTPVLLICGSREPYALKSHRLLRAVLPGTGA